MYKRGKFGRYATEIDKTFYRRWSDMKVRLRRSKYYINVKCLWKNFDEFYIDMYPGFVEHYSIYGKSDTTLDRIDYRGDYCKGNCRWATREQQSQNRSYNVNYTIEGETHCIAEWMRIVGVSFMGLKSKIKLYNDGKITKEEFLNPKYKPLSNSYYIVGGIKYSGIELQNNLGISRGTLRYRYNRLLSGKMSIEEFFKKANKNKSKTQMKIKLGDKEYKISDISKKGGHSRDYVSEQYNKLLKGKITEESFKLKFNLNNF